MTAVLALLAALAQAAPSPPFDCKAYPPAEASPYILPWPSGETHRVWVTIGHWTPRNRGVGLYAIDFEMPVGSAVTAARDGVVVATEGRYRDGNGENLKENHVFVRHADGTVARYFHLTFEGALVRVGQRVAQGQLIGRSGNTGESTGPHLHFDVQACGPNLPPHYNRLPCGRTVPVSFRGAAPQACGLVPGQVYRAPPR